MELIEMVMYLDNLIEDLEEKVFAIEIDADVWDIAYAEFREYKKLRKHYLRELELTW